MQAQKMQAQKQKQQGKTGAAGAAAVSEHNDAAGGQPATGAQAFGAPTAAAAAAASETINQALLHMIKASTPKERTRRYAPVWHDASLTIQLCCRACSHAALLVEPAQQQYHASVVASAES
jgi:hypothetical protein